MQLEKLSIFLQIVDTGSVSAAARLVHLSQPAVSRNLQQLEDDFGVSLFEREGRGLRLTAAGRALVPEARAILSRFEALRKSVRGTAERSYHDLRLGTVDSVVSFLFGHLVAPLRGAFPELGLKLTTGRTAQLLERVANDDLDLALVAYSGAPPAERVSRVARYDLQYYGRRDRFAELALATTDADRRRISTRGNRSSAGATDHDPRWSQVLRARRQPRFSQGAGARRLWSRLVARLHAG
ncbi:MAG: LysR family transcriptional regulator [Polyangiaceae bacterium]